MGKYGSVLLSVLAMAACGYIGYSLGRSDGRNEAAATILAKALPASTGVGGVKKGGWSTSSSRDEITDITTWEARSVGKEGTTLSFTCSNRGAFNAYFEASGIDVGDTLLAEYRAGDSQAVRGETWHAGNRYATAPDPEGLMRRALAYEYILVRIYDGGRTYVGHFNMLGARQAVDYIRTQCSQK
jgi:hypothetical protein